MEHGYQPLPSGRMHDFIVNLDLLDAGFLGWLIRLPERRRQVAFAVLSRAGANIPRTIRQSREVSQPACEQLLALHPVITDTRQLRSGDLLAKYFGSCPDGFVGAVEKTKVGPQHRLYYESLHAVFSDPGHRKIAKVIRQLSSCDWTKLSHYLTGAGDG